MSNAVLTASQDQHGRDAEKVSRLIAIRKWPKPAVVLPPEQWIMCQIEQNAKAGDDHHAKGEKAQLESRHAQFELLRRNTIKPAKPCHQTNETTGRQPRLWRNRIR